MRSSLSITIGGREVKATIDGSAFISQEDGAAALSFGSHKLVVEPERVLLDSKEIGKIPSDSKKVEVTHEGGKLAVVADGKAAIEVKTD